MISLSDEQLNVVMSRDLKSRPTSPEIEQAIANVNAVVVELEGGDKDIISPTTIKLADLVYRKVAEVIGMIVMADPNVMRGRQLKPQINKMIEQAEKTGKTVTSVTTPDGHTLRFGDTDDVSIAKNDWDTDKLQ
jgi:hypothetical protein